MTALHLARPRRLRPLGFLGASLVVVAAAQLGQVLAPVPPARAPEAPAEAAAGTGQGLVGGSEPLAALDPPGGGAATPGSLARIDRSIGAWTGNLARNDRDFLAAGALAVLYEARARLSGDVTDYLRSREAAERSLAIEPRQLDVRALHARLALATHDFTRAFDEAAALDAVLPEQPAILAIMADAQLELGDVDAAEALYAKIAGLAPGAAIEARLARLAFLRGDPAGALDRAAAAHAAAEAEGQRGPAIGWYAWLNGTLSLAAGSPDAAAAWFDRALVAWPDGHLALAGRARAAAALGDVDGAIELYRSAVAINPQPDALTALGDLLALRGDAAGANEQYATVRAIAALQADAGPVVDRQLSLFEVDHEGDVGLALALAERELSTRRDLYGWDAYAWALLANGRAAEADAAMGRALSLGTLDARLLYHAGEIALAVGDPGRARDLLERAVAIRGALDPLSAARAAETLASLR